MYTHKLLRIDPREDPPVVQEVNDYIPNEKRVPTRLKQTQYRLDCMNGMDHPMQIEVHNYILVTVATREMDTGVANTANRWGRWSRCPTFSQLEMEFIALIQRCPEVEWAIDNSFDGLYVAKEDNPATFNTQFRLAVYMKEEQATFWKLKFNER